MTKKIQQYPKAFLIPGLSNKRRHQLLPLQCLMTHHDSTATVTLLCDPGPALGHGLQVQVLALSYLKLGGGIHQTLATVLLFATQAEEPYGRE